jgi:hypothetical protein
MKLSLAYSLLNGSFTAVAKALIHSNTHCWDNAFLFEEGVHWMGQQWPIHLLQVNIMLADTENWNGTVIQQSEQKN